MNLAGQIAVVTGGGSGIGEATALAFQKAGAQVVIGGRRIEALQNVAKQCSGGLPIAARELDVAVRDNVNQFFTWVHATYGKIDILINAAGVNIRDRSMEAMPPQQWDDVMAINATGAYNCIYAVLPAMRQRKTGLIINISSVAGKRALALGGVAYSASKFAMTALGTCVSNEANQDNIRVTNVYPGEVNTPILDHRPTPVTEEHRQKILQPADVAQTLLALATLESHIHIPEIVVKPISQIWY